ncbi:unnamed protein product [Cunninghamella blakesleeana]
MDSTKKKFAVTANTLPNTKISNRNDIFNSDQNESQNIDEDAAKRMNELMNIMIMNNEVDQQSEEEQVKEVKMEDIHESEEEEKEEEEEFTFRLFSTGTPKKVSLKENTDDQMDYISQQVANKQELEFNEKDPELLVKINQAVIDYDDIIKQSTWSYPTLRLPKRVITISSSKKDKEKDNNDKSSINKKKRKSKKRRDFEKAVKEGRIQFDPHARNPEIHGPGWPYSKTPCAIINYDAIRHTIVKGGKYNFNNNMKSSSQHRPFNNNNSFRGRGNDRGRGRGGGRGNSRGGSRGGMRGGRGGSFRGKSH